MFVRVDRFKVFVYLDVESLASHGKFLYLTLSPATFESSVHRSPQFERWGNKTKMQKRFDKGIDQAIVR